MTASPSSRHPGARAALLAALLLLAPPAPAAAQDETRAPGAPLQLVPPRPGGTPAPPPRAAAAPAPEPVLAESLAPLDGSGIGLDEEGGGFADDMWEGATRPFVRDLVLELPAAAPSPAMRDLMRRVLIAGARPPEGQAGQPTLLAARAAKLAELGLVDELLALGQAGPLARDPDAAQALTRALLMAGRQGEACANAGTGTGAPDAWTQQLMVLCRLGEGRPEEARLGLELLRERGAGDAAVFALLEGIAEGLPPAVPDGVRSRRGRPDPLLVASLRAAGLPVAASPAPPADDPAHLVAIARDAASPAPARLEAAERAAAMGALAPAELAQLYSTVPLGSAEEIDRALEAAARAKGPRVRALLVQAAGRGDEARRAELQVLAVGLARSEGAALPVVLALLDPVVPSEVTAAVALDAARAYYAVGDLDRARAWHDAAGGAATTEAGDRAALARLWPLAMLAGALDGPAPDDGIAFGRTLEDWLEAELTVTGEAGVYSAAVTLAVFSALGERLDPGLWEQLAVDDSRDSTSLPSAGLWWRLPAAAQAGQAGTTALLALIALGEGGPAATHPALLERVLAALVEAGLEDDARRLAREAVWAVQL